MRHGEFVLMNCTVLPAALVYVLYMLCVCVCVCVCVRACVYNALVLVAVWVTTVKCVHFAAHHFNIPPFSLLLPIHSMHLLTLLCPTLLQNFIMSPPCLNLPFIQFARDPSFFSHFILPTTLLLSLACSVSLQPKLYNNYYTYIKMYTFHIRQVKSNANEAWLQ